MTHELAFCRKDQIDAVMRFIDAHYRPGHVLGRRRDLFEWQYLDRDRDTCRMVVATDPARREILGVLGYVLNSQYDPALAAGDCLWLALWQVRPRTGIATLGTELLRFLRSSVPHEFLAVAGFNPAHRRMYRAMGFRVTSYTQFYILNPEIEDFEIVDIATPSRPARLGRALALVDGIDDALDVVQVPRKTAAFFRCRYLEHPFYRYQVAGIVHDGAPVGLIALRVARHGDRCALRVVDLLLDRALVGELAGALLERAQDLGCEYVDLLAVGLDADLLLRSGFARVDEETPNTVPTYFEPFLRENRTILVSHRGGDADAFVAFKGDGDQDRPNLL